MKKFLSILASISMVLGLVSLPVKASEAGWVDKADTSWYNTTDTTFNIDTAEELAGLAELVNAGNNFEKKTVNLIADVDLEGKEWMPIGNKATPFKGTFNGNDKTISNLVITRGLEDAAANNRLGLFGIINSPAKLHNFTIDNAKVKGSWYAAAVCGNAYTGTIENVNVTGLIQIDCFWDSAIISGYGYAKLDNAHVKADEGSYVTGHDSPEKRSGFIGGIWGYRGEGNIHTTNCSIENVEVSCGYLAGGLVGYLQYSNTVKNCSVKNVTVNGGIPGYTDVYFGYAGENIVTADNTNENMTLTVKVGTMEDLLEAANKATGDYTITLTDNIALTQTVEFNKEANITIDGSGYKITQDESFDNTNCAFMLGSSLYNDSAIATHKVTIKDTVFEGFKKSSVIRSQGVDLTIDGCTFTNNDLSGSSSFGMVLRIDATELKVVNSTFENNTAEGIIAFNYNVNNSNAKVIVESCTFEENSIYSTAVVYYANGTKCDIKNNRFVKNTVSTNSNSAVIYLGFMENCTVTGNLFKDNENHCTGTSERISGGIFAGYDAVIENNAFDGNSAENANGSDGIGQSMCLSVYYTDFNVGKNYWDGKEPVEGIDYLVQHTSSGNKMTVDGYASHYVFDKGVSLKEHDSKRINVVEATCEKDGYTGDVYCNTCEKIIEYGEVVKASGHTFVNNACACGATIKVEVDTSSSNAKEDVNISTNNNKEAIETVKKETMDIVSTVVSDASKTEELVESGVISEDTAEALKEAVVAGKSVDTIILVQEVKEVDEKVAESIEKEVQETLGETAKIQYLDISIVLCADDEVLGFVNKLSKPIVITVQIPKEMQMENGKYVVVRNHDGIITLLETKNNGDGTISFTTDQFSTYAIAYVETKSPETGDTTNVAGLLAMLLASAYVMARKVRA